MSDRTRTTLSIRNDIFDYGTEQCEKYFQGNFSMFVGFLISGCKAGLFNIESVFTGSDSISKPSSIVSAPVNESNGGDVAKLLSSIDSYFK